MPLAAPTISPVTPYGVLETYDGVTATAQVHDQGANDVTSMHWGCFEPISSTVGKPNDPIAIPSPQVCNGTVEVWYLGGDAIGNTSYSAVASVNTQDTSHFLPAPTLAPSGSTPAEGMEVTVSVKVAFNPSLKLVAGDNIKLTIELYEITKPGWRLIRTATHNYPVESGGDSMTMHGVTPSPSASQGIITYFHLEKTASGQGPQPRRYQAFLSATKQQFGSEWYPPTPKELPAPVFTDAQNGVLNLITLPAGQDVGLKIPSTAVITSTSVVQIHGWGTDQEGKAIAAANWQSAPITSIVATPYTGTPIPRDRVNAVPDQGHYFAQYTVDGNEDSPPTAVQIKNVSGPAPGQTGSLWGWGSTDSGVLG
ncbi:hypothetical protein [Bordetella sp. LUAb4]|uniref:hypothetical protein n=1 Tax=Bordetella sp. LUAb4 TaxID=2843195 RepID=UPI001E2CF955|nr:hypothetical protein [Bordetella sp. LUAb4]